MPIDRNTMRLGFALPEAVLALVILGMAAAGVLLPFSSGAATQAEGIHRTQAARLADDLMEQIIATPYDQIVSEWNGYTEVQGQVKRADGVVFTDTIYGKFSRDATCEEVYVRQQSLQTQWVQPPPCFILVVVNVYDQGRPIATLRRLISQ